MLKTTNTRNNPVRSRIRRTLCSLKAWLQIQTGWCHFLFRPILPWISMMRQHAFLHHMHQSTIANPWCLAHAILVDKAPENPSPHTNLQHRMTNLFGGTAGGCMPVLVLESHGDGISIQELMGCQVLSHPTASVQLHHPIPFALVMHRTWTSRPFGNLIC